MVVKQISIVYSESKSAAHSSITFRYMAATNECLIMYHAAIVILDPGLALQKNVDERKLPSPYLTIIHEPAAVSVSWITN